MIRTILSVLAVAVILLLIRFHPTHHAGNLVEPVTKLNYWHLEYSLPANSSISLDGDAMRCDVVKVDGKGGSIRLFQYHLALQEGRQYHVHFMAKADRDLVIGLTAETNYGDYHNQGLTKQIPLVRQWVTYDYLFTAEKADNRPDRFPYFRLGDSVGTMWIKDITVEEA